MAPNWNARYQTGDTPWDKGEPHPELPFLLRTHHELLAKTLRILVPGCGYGHDAQCIASEFKAQVTGLDIASFSVDKAAELHSEDNLNWEVSDLFEDQSGPYELIFEHTCFCAIPLDRRADYVSAVARLIPSGGHLLGIFFLNPDHKREEGPPFGVTPTELDKYFTPHFTKIWEQEPSATYPSREGAGRERSILWQRQ